MANKNEMTIIQMVRQQQVAFDFERLSKIRDRASESARDSRWAYNLSAKLDSTLDSDTYLGTDFLRQSMFFDASVHDSLEQCKYTNVHNPRPDTNKR